MDPRYQSGFQRHVCNLNDFCQLERLPPQNLALEYQVFLTTHFKGAGDQPTESS